MKRNDFFEIIENTINPLIINLGYEYKKSKKSWIKRIPDFRFELTIDCFKVGNQFNTFLSFSVRNHLVQNIMNHYSDINPTEYKNTNTLNLYLTNLIHFKDHSFTFYNEDELMQVVDKYYIPFIKIKLEELTLRYSDLKNILKVLIDPLAEYYGLTKYLYYDKILPIIIAKVLNLNEYNQIVNIMRSDFEKLKQKCPECNEIRYYKNHFDILVNDLKEM